MSRKVAGNFLSNNDRKVSGNFLSSRTRGEQGRKKIFKDKKMFGGKVDNPFNPPIKVKLHQAPKRLRA